MYIDHPRRPGSQLAGRPDQTPTHRRPPACCADAGAPAEADPRRPQHRRAAAPAASSACPAPEEDATGCGGSKVCLLVGELCRTGENSWDAQRPTASGSTGGDARSRPSAAGRASVSSVRELVCFCVKRNLIHRLPATSTRPPDHCQATSGRPPSTHSVQLSRRLASELPAPA